MKRCTTIFSLIIGLIMTILCIFPTASNAATFNKGENYTLEKNEGVSGDLYALGANTTIAGDVSGDLIAAGLNVYVGGNTIARDTLIFGDYTNIISDIKGNLRVVGRNIFVSSTVAKDAAFLTWDVQIQPQSVIGGDFLAAAGNVEMLGKIDGSARIASGSVYINGTIGGNVSIDANRVILGPHALVIGDFIYSASEPAVLQSGAKINGKTSFTQINTQTRTERFLPTVWGTISILQFAIVLLSALVIHGILRKISERFVAVSIQEFGWSLLRGFLFVIGVPVAAFVGTLTLIALPFSIFAMILYGIGIFLSLIYAPIVIGSLIRKALYRGEPIKVNWKTILLGVIVSTTLGYIPYLGVIIWYLFVVVVLGGIYQVLFEKFREVR